MGQSSQIALFLGAERRGEMSRELSSAFQMLLDALGSSIWGLVSEIGGRFVHDAYASLWFLGIGMWIHFIILGIWGQAQRKTTAVCIL